VQDALQNKNSIHELGSGIIAACYTTLLASPSVIIRIWITKERGVTRSLYWLKMSCQNTTATIVITSCHLLKLL